MPKNDGGTVFPHPERESGFIRDGQHVTRITPASAGLSIRDYFAAKAMAGLVVGCSGMLGLEPSAYAKGPCNSVMVERAYALADAMLAEREKGEQADE